jgi:uncharacterized damage-inducible protein DinB
MDDKIFRKALIDSLTSEDAHLSVESAIKDLKSENRNRKPSAVLHSVWQQLEHIKICQEDILQYILDPNWKSPAWPEGYWPKKIGEISDGEWSNLFNKFRNDLQKLVNIISDSRIDLTSIIPHTKNHTYLREILIVIDHNSYHTAQIIHTRKILEDWNE